MTDKEIREVERLLKGSEKFIGNCVDGVGYPKKPTVNQLRKFETIINKFQKAFKNFEYTKP